MPVKTSLNAELSMHGGNISISGVLNFDTVPVLMKKAEQLLANQNEISVDLANVTDSNSAGLALLLEMVRITKLQKKSINFENLPEQICIVATAYGIESELDSFLGSPLNC